MPRRSYFKIIGGFIRCDEVSVVFLPSRFCMECGNYILVSGKKTEPQACHRGLEKRIYAMYNGVDTVF